LVLSSGLSLPVTASFLRNHPVAVQGPAPGEVVVRLAIGPAVAGFLLLAMADHLLVASPGLHRWYEATMARRANYARHGPRSSRWRSTPGSGFPSPRSG
jgi:hypothetical protein